MKTRITLPMASLTRIEDISADLELTLKQYQSLLSLKPEYTTRNLMAILEEKIGPSVWKIARADFIHLVLMMRIATFGDEITLSFKHVECGSDVTQTFKLSSLEDKDAPADYVVREFEFDKVRYRVLPPTMKLELALDELFSSKDLSKPEDIRFVALYRACAFLRPVYGENDSLESVVKLTKVIEQQPLSAYRKLLDYQKELDGFGPQLYFSARCENCEKEVHTRIPFRFIANFNI